MALEVRDRGLSLTCESHKCRKASSLICNMHPSNIFTNFYLTNSSTLNHNDSNTESHFYKILDDKLGPNLNCNIPYKRGFFFENLILTKVRQYSCFLGGYIHFEIMGKIVQKLGEMRCDRKSCIVLISPVTF